MHGLHISDFVKLIPQINLDKALQSMKISRNPENLWLKRQQETGDFKAIKVAYYNS